MLTQQKLTFNKSGITPAVRMTAKAPTGSTHPGASTLPGSATPLAAIRGTTVCSTLVTPAPDAGSGATIVVDCRVAPNPLPLDDEGATTKASAEEARHRAAVVTEKSFMSEKKLGSHLQLTGVTGLENRTVGPYPLFSFTQPPFFFFFFLHVSYDEEG